MPLVAHTKLPSYDRLRQEGHEVLDPDRAVHQDIRELHIGLLNLMPDAALQATERQFMRLIGSCNRIAQFYIHVFTGPGVARQGAAKKHVEQHYEDFERLKVDGLDALVITGANPANPDITQEGFWPDLVEAMEWGGENTCSVLCSCLATHAAFKHFHGIERTKLPDKRWGVYSHDVTNQSHPLVANVNTRFDAPHSHVYGLTKGEVESVGGHVLAYSKEADFHLAVSADGFRYVYFQGHPEYDIHSLLKEYKREAARYVDHIRDDYPPFPEHYFGKETKQILSDYRIKIDTSRKSGKQPPEFPEREIIPFIHNTWSDTGKAMFNTWLGLVYQLTNKERIKLFMPGVDPDDPLDWKQTKAA